MKSKNRRSAERAKSGSAGMASATRGRGRKFTDRKKQASKRACRGKQDDE